MLEDAKAIAPPDPPSPIIIEIFGTVKDIQHSIELAIAECYWKLRKPLLSKKHINNVLKTNPFEPEALEMLADQMIFDKQYGSALDPLTKLIQKFPNRVKYLVTLAEVEKILGNSIKSIDHYLNAYKIDSTNLNFLETYMRGSIRA